MASRVGVDIGWRSLEKDSHPGTPREPPSRGSYVAGPPRAGPRLDRRGCGVRHVGDTWTPAACPSLARSLL